MITTQEVKKAVSEFGPREMSRFRAWYEMFDAKVWDEQFEKDVQAGKLDALAQKALNDLKKGRCKEL